MGDQGVTEDDVRALREHFADRPLEALPRPAQYRQRVVGRAIFHVPELHMRASTLATDASLTVGEPVVTLAAVWGDGRAECIWIDMGRPGNSVAAEIEALRRALLPLPDGMAVTVYSDCDRHEAIAANARHGKLGGDFSLERQFHRLNVDVHHATDQRAKRRWLFHPLLGVTHRVAYVANRGLGDGRWRHPSFIDVLIDVAGRPMRKDSVKHAYRAAAERLGVEPVSDDAPQPPWMSAA